MKEEEKQKFKVYCVPKPTPYVINDYEGFMRASEEQRQNRDYQRMMKSLDKIKINVEEIKKDDVIKLQLRRKPDKK